MVKRLKINEKLLREAEPKPGVSYQIFDTEVIGLAARVADIRIHDLRHTFASMMVSVGASLEMIGKLLGRSQMQIAQRYAHVMDSPVRAGIDTVAREAHLLLKGQDRGPAVHPACAEPLDWDDPVAEVWSLVRCALHTCEANQNLKSLKKMKNQPVSIRSERPPHVGMLQACGISVDAG